MHRFILAFLLLPGLAYAAAPPGVSVQNPWARYLLPGLPASLYLRLTNQSDFPAILIGARSPACAALMLHESMDMGGTAMMMAVPNAPLPAHGSLALAEGGYHFMCMSPAMQPGGFITLTLEFQDGTNISLRVPVYGATSAP